MTMASPRGSPAMTAFPRSISTIMVSVGGLAMFFVFASLLLVSYPIGSTVRGYFYGVDRLVLPISLGNKTTIDRRPDGNVNQFDKNLPSGPSFEVPNNKSSTPTNANLPVAVSSRVTVDTSGSKDNALGDTTPASTSSDSKAPSLSLLISNATKTGSGDSGGSFFFFGSTYFNFLQPSIYLLLMCWKYCDLYHGSWFYDTAGPLYTNDTCPVLTQMQNCQGNGRPDKEYENWRWKPFQCHLPRFDGKKFLELMRGKTLAFIGDSVARNQMESMLCLLWRLLQVEIPKNRGNKRMQRWFFRSTNTMIVRIWSSWLVHKTSGTFNFAPEGVTKLHLDAPDEDFMEFIPQFDVIVLSSGHWFAKQSVYILNNEIVGGQLWWPDKSRPMKVNNIEAFGISVETILTALGTHPNYTGLTIVRSYSPDHYEGGAWNTGGSCTGKVRPLEPGELVENGFTDVMHKKQVMGFDHAIKKLTNKSRLRLMDITEAFGYRHDGHPGPYRNPDPNKITKRGPDGKPPPQDCLHWCMPGPVDTWNELVLETIRRDFEGNQSFSS
ncbi:PC-Esterase domain-containing protein/PMR5N domain-containing protein [Cephalotus follicularis]|uniref:PC-Esterase domain-containing protein/PMR5N domain-containing protein n=1 Tax=Cephalotus follicularis TaxID=3775 RepID=A0A1Q3B1N1_CEPFO|nr:PC-Esterase domain-containing protein/PMR5N domain-containing protein [Cephalotus follicularis]